MDTVVIKIYGPKKFQFDKKDWFVPEIYSRSYEELSETEKHSNRHYLKRFILKVPKNTRYTPKVEVLETIDRENKKTIYILIITFSVPKLLYGNSLQEASENDFEKVVSKLQHVLSNAGIRVSSGSIKTARVEAAHFCKNVPLPKHIRLQDILSELQKVDISKAYDVTTKETKEGGRILHLYSGIREIVFYDKVVDSLRPKAKRKDKGYIHPERAVIEKNQLQNLEVFRLEHRIKKTRTIAADINQALGRKPGTYLMFQDLFTPGLFQKMLLKAWDDLLVRPENQLALIGPNCRYRQIERIFETAKRDGKANSMNRAFVAYGIAVLIRELGVKETKRLVFRHWNNDHPERLNAKIEMAFQLSQEISFSEGMSIVDIGIRKFEPIKINSYTNEV
jgi:hypothetical protein